MYKHKIHASSHYAHEKEMHYVMIKQWEHRWGIGTLEEKEKELIVLNKKKKKRNVTSSYLGF